MEPQRQQQLQVQKLTKLRTSCSPSSASSFGEFGLQIFSFNLFGMNTKTHEMNELAYRRGACEGGDESEAVDGEGVGREPEEQGLPTTAACLHSTQLN